MDCGFVYKLVVVNESNHLGESLQHSLKNLLRACNWPLHLSGCAGVMQSQKEKPFRKNVSRFFKTLQHLSPTLECCILVKLLPGKKNLRCVWVGGGGVNRIERRFTVFFKYLMVSF